MLAILSAALLAAAPASTAGGPPWPLGEVQQLAGPQPCEQQECYRLEVKCRQLARPELAYVKVGRATGAPARGTIVFFGEGTGTKFWDSFGEDARAALAALRSAGFTTAQVRWQDGWMVGAAGRLEGHALLACKPATLTRWIHDRLHARGSKQAFCATGNSGGSAQASYLLSHYGLEDILDAVVPSSGPPMGRLDWGCFGGSAAGGVRLFEPDKARLIDRGFGFAGDGPCARQDRSYRERYEAASVAASAADLVYPRTALWFIFGEKDSTNAVMLGRAYLEALRAAGAPSVRETVVQGAGHSLPRSAAGAQAIRDALMEVCRRPAAQDLR